MKYRWSLRRFWISWIKQDMQRWYYSIIYGWNTGGLNGTHLPLTGKGKYVSVYSKGKIIQIIDESAEYDEIRIIPYQPNHGVLVETIKNNKVSSRTILGICQLNKNIIYASNIESLAKKKDPWKNTLTNPPKESGRYWGYIKFQGDLGISYYQDNVYFDKEENYWTSDNIKKEGGIVTHWVPLLKPPI